MDSCKVSVDVCPLNVRAVHVRLAAPPLSNHCWKGRQFYLQTLDGDDMMMMLMAAQQQNPITSQNARASMNGQATRMEQQMNERTDWERE
jgi:hypothetical protein